MSQSLTNSCSEFDKSMLHLREFNLSIFTNSCINHGKIHAREINVTTLINTTISTKSKKASVTLSGSDIQGDDWTLVR